MCVFISSSFVCTLFVEVVWIVILSCSITTLDDVLETDIEFTLYS